MFLALGTIVSAAAKFEDFPTSVTCEAEGDSTINVVKVDLQSAIVGPKGTKVDDSAANVASGKCVHLSGIPLYAVCRKISFSVVLSNHGC